MDSTDRLREAIKQTQIAIENEDEPDTIELLESGLESLEHGIDSIKDESN